MDCRRAAIAGGGFPAREVAIGAPSIRAKSARSMDRQLGSDRDTILVQATRSKGNVPVPASRSGERAEGVDLPLRPCGRADCRRGRPAQAMAYASVAGL